MQLRFTHRDLTQTASRACPERKQSSGKLPMGQILYNQCISSIFTCTAIMALEKRTRSHVSTVEEFDNYSNRCVSRSG